MALSDFGEAVNERIMRLRVDYNVYQRTWQDSATFPGLRRDYDTGYIYEYSTHGHIIGCLHLLYSFLICDRPERMDSLQAWTFGHGCQSSINIDHNSTRIEGVMAMLANSMLTSQ